MFGGVAKLNQSQIYGDDQWEQLRCRLFPTAKLTMMIEGERRRSNDVDPLMIFPFQSKGGTMS